MLPGQVDEAVCKRCKVKMCRRQRWPREHQFNVATASRLPQRQPPSNFGTATGRKCGACGSAGTSREQNARASLGALLDGTKAIPKQLDGS